jgi:hypothetical protein
MRVQLALALASLRSLFPANRRQEAVETCLFSNEDLMFDKGLVVYHKCTDDCLYHGEDIKHSADRLASQVWAVDYYAWSEVLDGKISIQYAGLNKDNMMECYTIFWADGHWEMPTYAFSDGAYDIGAVMAVRLARDIGSQQLEDLVIAAAAQSEFELQGDRIAPTFEDGLPHGYTPAKIQELKAEMDNYTSQPPPDWILPYTKNTILGQLSP